MEIGYLTALLAGALALLSPCGALLLPSFFAVTFASRTRLLAHTGVFYAGLVTTLAPLGAGAALAGSLLTAHRGTLVTVAGIVIIALGAAQVLGGGLDLRRFLPERLTRAATPGGTDRGSVVLAYTLGVVSGVAGFCTGPILGAVLTLAMTSGSPALGAALLSVYGAGMALPLLVIALVWSRRGGRRSRLRGRTFTVGPLTLHTTSTVTGLLFIGVGVLFIATNGLVTAPALLPTEVAGSLQSAAVDLAARVPDELLVVAAAGAVLAVWFRYQRLSRSSDRDATDPRQPTGAGSRPRRG